MPRRLTGPGHQPEADVGAPDVGDQPGRAIERLAHGLQRHGRLRMAASDTSDRHGGIGLRKLNFYSI
jgi:hypothetical protein